MNLQIRDPRAHELARRLAELRRVSMTAAVIEALESEVERVEGKADLIGDIEAIQDRLRRAGRPGGRDFTKDEIDDMWTDAI